MYIWGSLVVLLCWLDQFQVELFESFGNTVVCSLPSEDHMLCDESTQLDGDLSLLANCFPGCCVFPTLKST